MDSTTEWSEQVKAVEGIGGERRNDRRYGIQLELRWKLIRRRRVLDSGVGRTVDLSSGGLLFDCGRQLPVGLNVELAISWPVLLHNQAPLQLIVSGRIVRCASNRTAVMMAQHEFRTSGASADQRAALAAAARPPSAWLAACGAVPSHFGKYRLGRSTPKTAEHRVRPAPRPRCFVSGSGTRTPAPLVCPNRNARETSARTADLYNEGL